MNHRKCLWIHPKLNNLSPKRIPGFSPAVGRGRQWDWGGRSAPSSGEGSQAGQCQPNRPRDALLPTPGQPQVPQRSHKTLKKACERPSDFLQARVKVNLDWGGGSPDVSHQPILLASLLPSLVNRKDEGGGGDILNLRPES